MHPHAALCPQTLSVCCTALHPNQARRQNSVTGGGDRNKFWGGHEKFTYVNSRGPREIYPSLDQMNKVKTKDSKGFSGRNQKFKLFFRPKTGDLQKKKKKVFTEILSDFPAEIRNSNAFSGPNQVKKKVFTEILSDCLAEIAFSGDLKKKKGPHWNSKWFSGRNQKFKRFFRPKTSYLQK